MAKKGYLYQVKPLFKSVQRFLSVDPAAADFAAWSTYAYVLDNPNIFVDPTGKAPEDIIILLSGKASSNLFSGHAAILIGDDESGWTYISKDGGTSISSGSAKLTIKPFDTLESFANGRIIDESASSGSSSGSSSIGGGGYKEGLRIYTDPSVNEDATNESYNIVTSNCTVVCQSVLDFFAINTNKSIIPRKLVNGLKKDGIAEVVDLEALVKDETDDEEE